MKITRALPVVFAAAVALLGTGTAFAQQSFQLSSKVLEARFSGEQQRWDGQHRFGNVLCLEFPRAKRWASISMSSFMNRLSLLVLASFLSFTAVAQEVASFATNPEKILAAIKTQLPKPPEGFIWHLYKNAVFFRPDSWNEHEKSSNTGGIPFTTYAASPEEFSNEKQFEMGLTVQIISSSQKVRGIEAKKAALLYLKPFLDAHKKEEILKLEQSTNGDFERTFFRYRDAPPGLKPIIVHKFILANNVTDSVHIFTFESPAELWQQNWEKYGTPILSKVSVLPNVAAN